MLLAVDECSERCIFTSLELEVHQPLYHLNLILLLCMCEHEFLLCLDPKVPQIKNRYKLTEKKFDGGEGQTCRSSRRCQGPLQEWRTE
jgi:hypothetical protein